MTFHEPHPEDRFIQDFITDLRRRWSPGAAEIGYARELALHALDLADGPDGDMRALLHGDLLAQDLPARRFRMPRSERDTPGRGSRAAASRVRESAFHLSGAGKARIAR